MHVGRYWDPSSSIADHLFLVEAKLNKVGCRGHDEILKSEIKQLDCKWGAAQSSEASVLLSSTHIFNVNEKQQHIFFFNLSPCIKMISSDKLWQAPNNEDEDESLWLMCLWFTAFPFLSGFWSALFRSSLIEWNQGQIQSEEPKQTLTGAKLPQAPH